MTAKRILVFISVIFSFYVTDACFAEDAKEAITGIDKGAMAVTVDGFKKINLRDAIAGDFGTFHSATASLTGGYTLLGTRTRTHLSDRTSEMFKVLSVLDKRVRDKSLLEKVKDKLPTLNEDRLQIIASLSESIADEGHSAKTDIAFLLLATLIVFS